MIRAAVTLQPMPMVEVLAEDKPAAVLAASFFHFGDIKQSPAHRAVPLRLPETIAS